MEYVRLGSTGLKVSRICLGHDDLRHAGVAAVGARRGRQPPVLRARARARHQLLRHRRHVLARRQRRSGRAARSTSWPRRDEVVIATKAFYPLRDGPNQRGLSRKHLFDAIDDSLRRLGTDYVDLYQIHRFDYDTPIEETLEALHDIVKAGKARYIGASSMYAWQFAKMLHAAEAHGWTRFVSMQNHYNLVYREEEREMMPLCREEGIGVIPWSPLARGFLAGNRRSGRSAATPCARRPTTSPTSCTTASRTSRWPTASAELAKRRGVTPAQMALAWLLAKPGVTAPIVGASKLPQLDEAVAAIELRLDAGEMTFLEELYQPHRILGHS